jgi:HJR/Mrr/RecB family endonuclease
MNVAAALFARLNVAIESAILVGEVNVERQQPSSADQGAEELQESAESQLIDVVPATALENLRRVEFAPLTLLDRILGDPTLMRRLHSREFEGFVASLVEQLGFEDVVLTPRSDDGGRDVLATKNIHGLSIVFAFECKRYSPKNKVGPDIARALLGTITHGTSRATKGVLVTTSSFTPAAKRFILTEPHLDGKDFDGIVEWLREYSNKRRHI